MIEKIEIGFFNDLDLFDDIRFKFHYFNIVI